MGHWKKKLVATALLSALGPVGCQTEGLYRECVADDPVDSSDFDAGVSTGMGGSSAHPSTKPPTKTATAGAMSTATPQRAADAGTQSDKPATANRDAGTGRSIGGRAPSEADMADDQASDESTDSENVPDEAPATDGSGTDDQSSMKEPEPEEPEPADTETAPEPAASTAPDPSLVAGTAANCQSYTASTSEMCGGWYCGVSPSELALAVDPLAKCGGDVELLCDNTVVTTVSRCARMIQMSMLTITSDELRPLVQECAYKDASIRKSTPPTCLACIIDGAICTSDKCLRDCLYGDSERCDTCRQKSGCDQNVFRCGGLPAPF
jgi:hypothetical protein